MSETQSPSGPVRALAVDEQQLQMLRESAADVVARSVDFKRLRERRGTLPGHEPAHLATMVELGWLAILVPEPHGGLGLGLTEMAAVLQALGKGLMGDPLAPLALATRVLAHPEISAGWPAAATRLAAVAEGSALPVLAWQEGLGGIDPSSIATVAAPAGDGWVLRGRKRFVAGSGVASSFLVSARPAGGEADIGLLWVDADAPGLAVSHEWRADQTPSGVLVLDGVRVVPANVIAAPGAQATRALRDSLDDAAVLVAAEMLGVVEAALQLTLAYLRTRVQFGKPIGSFQALQHKAADLYVQQELLRAVLQDALLVLDNTQPRDPQAAAAMASRCKARASDVGLRVTREIIQLHGAIGFTDEHDAGLYLKRALVLSAWLGNAGAHRARFADLQDAAAAL